MSKAFLLYRLQPGPAVVAVRLALGDNGRVTLTPGDDWVEAGMALVGHGVGSIRQFRTITPDEGEVYIQAIQGMLSTSSVWTLVPEAAAGDDRVDAGATARAAKKPARRLRSYLKPRSGAGDTPGVE